MQESLNLIIKKFIYSVLGFHPSPIIDNFTNAVGNFIFILSELVFLFILITAVIEFFLIYVNHNKLNKYLKGNGLKGNFAGAILGSLTPFCACSTIPMTVGFMNAGIPFGAVISFLISSPLLNPVIISMLTATIGLKYSILYFFFTFSLSIGVGYFMEITGFSKYIKKVSVKGTGKMANDVNFLKNLPLKNKLSYSLKKGIDTLIPILPYIIIGVAIGSLIYGYMPEETFIAKYAGKDNFFAVPLASVIGIPLYIRAESAIPIAFTLISKGVGLGTSIALIIGGAGMAIPEMTMLSKIFRKKLLISFILVIFFVSSITGYIFNIIS